jgi:hypothetical protein
VVQGIAVVDEVLRSDAVEVEGWYLALEFEDVADVDFRF